MIMTEVIHLSGCSGHTALLKGCGVVSSALFSYLGKIGSAGLGWLYQVHYKLLIAVVYRAGNVARVCVS